MLAVPEVNTLGPIKPPAIHRWAFHTQWLFALAGVLLLLLSKASPLMLPPTNIPPKIQAEERTPAESAKMSATPTPGQKPAPEEAAQKPQEMPVP